MQKIYLLVTIILFIYQSQAQTISPEGLFSVGEHFSNGFAQISYTIGDLVTSTYAKEDIVLTQGFLQPNFTITKIDKIDNFENIKVDVYPNPVKDLLNIKCASNISSQLFLSLYSLDGKLVFEKKLETFQIDEQVNFKPYISGYYILKLFSEEIKFEKTYKILFQK